MNKTSLVTVAMALMTISIVGFAADNNMQQSVNKIQAQVQQVASSVPQQIKTAQDANQQSIKQLRAELQTQITALQQQIQKVQDQTAQRINTVQNEVQQLKVRH